MISTTEIEDLAEEALSELLKNVVVVVEQEPTDEDMDYVQHAGDELLGIFRRNPPLPDQVAIFRGPILRTSRSRRDAKREIRDTVIHELGHYFGLDDEGM